jgi:hypothetical protein
VSSHSFWVDTREATSDDFGEFLEFLGEWSVETLDFDRGLAFLLFCGLLGNNLLALTLLALLHSIGCGVGLVGGFFVGGVSRAISFCDVDSGVDFSASLFYLYSKKELQQLDRSLLHRILGSPSLSLHSEDAFLNLLLGLGDDYQELMNYVEVGYLSARGIARFVDGVKFADLTPKMWGGIETRLKSANLQELPSDRIAGWGESAILDVLPVVLIGFLKKKWKLLYRGSDDGFGASNFHKKCDGIANTVTIILSTTGCIFGGFTPIAWESNGGYKPDSANQSFVFRIKDTRQSEPRKFPLSNPSCAIHCYQSWGPTFGNGRDIAVVDCCNQNSSSYTNLGVSYANDTEIDGKQVFTGEFRFTVKEIEVFTINE